MLTRLLRCALMALAFIAAFAGHARGGEGGPLVELEREAAIADVLDGLTALSRHPADLDAPFDAFATALRAGILDEAALSSCVDALDEPAARAKYDLALRDLAQRVLGGKRSLTALELHASGSSTTESLELLAASRDMRVLALCNSCLTPAPLPAPGVACQFVSGDTTAACPSDFYVVTLSAAVPYEFTTCTGFCPGATAAFDTRIRILDPATCAILVENDDWCGLQSRTRYTPPVTGSYVVELTGFDAASFGAYALGYREDDGALACGTCATPVATLVPAPVPQQVHGCNVDCPNTSTASEAFNGVWYAMTLTAGERYRFATCPFALGLTCGSGGFDTRLDLWDATCTTRVAGNDDIACSLIFRSAFEFVPATTATYKLQVRGFLNDVGCYDLCYGVEPDCVDAAIVSHAPVAGLAGPTDCSITESFTLGLDAAATPPFAGTWTITPPPGGFATPASGAMSFSGTTGAFTSTLLRPPCGPPSFGVSATVINCSGAPVTRSWTYVLDDVTPPLAVGCPPSVTLDCTDDAPTDAPSASDGCDPAPTVTLAETMIAGPCPGNRTLERRWTLRDCNGNTRFCAQDVAFVDTTPPSVVGVDAWCAWPPNHDYHCVAASELRVSVTDDCSPSPTLVLTGCRSNEPDDGTGDGDTEDDCVISADGLRACLRVERAGTLSDRVYVLLGAATDECGNASAPAPVAVVTVPHDRRAHGDCRRANAGRDAPP